MSLPILFKILSGTFSAASKTFFARVMPRGVLGHDDVVKRMLLRGTSFTEVDLRGAIRLYEQEVMEAVAEGYHVNTPVFNARPTIKGHFESKRDVFDPARHSIEVTLSKGTAFTKRMKKATAQREIGKERKPMPVSFTDHNSGVENQTLTGGSIGELYGYELKYEAGEPKAGIFFIDTVSKQETQVRVVSILEPQKLMFQIPVLAPGTYQIVVRKYYAGTKSLRQGILPDNLVCS
ncbi:MAG TPA: DNA-binding domain-containing protein [Catalimonadaceae bacterium]|nr:DNA-binding domain-containing protein [Catalimonadaceae bacterium]